MNNKTSNHLQYFTSNVNEWVVKTTLLGTLCHIKFKICRLHWFQKLTTINLVQFTDHFLESGGVAPHTPPPVRSVRLFILYDHITMQGVNKFSSFVLDYTHRIRCFPRSYNSKSDGTTNSMVALCDNLVWEFFNPCIHDILKYFLWHQHYRQLGVHIWRMLNLMW